VGAATIGKNRGRDRLHRGGAHLAALCAVVVLALAGCSSSSSAAPATSPTATGAAVSLDISISGGTVSPAPGESAIALGSAVHLSVTSDAADEVHVHGYNLEKEVPAGGTVTFDFTADQAGTFEVETHESDLLLTKLVVS
jgi:hypothetical protein